MSCSSSSYQPKKRGRQGPHENKLTKIEKVQQFDEKVVQLVEHDQKDIIDIFNIFKNNRTLFDVVQSLVKVETNKDRKYDTLLKQLSYLIRDSKYSKKTFDYKLYCKDFMKDADFCLLSMLVHKNIITNLVIYWLSLKPSHFNFFNNFRACSKLSKLELDKMRLTRKQVYYLFSSLNFFKFTLKFLKLANNDLIHQITNSPDNDIYETYDLNLFDGLNLDFWKNNTILESLYIDIYDKNIIRFIYNQIFRIVCSQVNNISHFYWIWDKTSLGFSDKNSVIYNTNQSIYDELYENIFIFLNNSSENCKLKELYINVNGHDSDRNFLDDNFYPRLFTALSKPDNVLNNLNLHIKLPHEGLFKLHYNDLFEIFLQNYALKLEDFTFSFQSDYYLYDIKNRLISLTLKTLRTISSNNTIKKLTILQSDVFQPYLNRALLRLDGYHGNFFFRDNNITFAILDLIKKYNIQEFNLHGHEEMTWFIDDLIFDQIIEALNSRNNLTTFSLISIIQFPLKTLEYSKLRDAMDSRPGLIYKIDNIREIIDRNLKSMKNKNDRLFDHLWNHCFDAKKNEYKKQLILTPKKTLKKARNR